MNENEISKHVVDSAYHIHQRLGPGLLESVYEAILTHELKRKGLAVETQAPIPVVWDSVIIEQGYRADLIVGGKLLVELKSVESVLPVHSKQVFTYLKLLKLRLGLLINFGAPFINRGIKRIAHGLPD